MAAFRVFKLNVIAKVFYITKEICPGYAEAMLSFTRLHTALVGSFAHDFRACLL
jgi:hypothetical protein